MTLDDFYINERQNLDSFKKYWEEQSDLSFPKELSLEEWDEQFLIWREGVEK